MYIPNLLPTLHPQFGHALLRRLRQPTLLCSTSGEVLHSNEAALALLASTTLVRISHGKLRFRERAQAEFQANCAAMARQAMSHGERSHSFRLLQLSAGHSAERIYAFYTLLEPQLFLEQYGVEPLILLFFYHPESASILDIALLKQALRLSPAECRIAAMLMEGLSVKKIASVLGTQQDTVRKQLQSIYKKTSTKRQSELIRLLLNLPSYTLDQRATDEKMGCRSRPQPV